MAQNYRELIAWQKSVDLVVDVYKLVSTWPREGQFGLSSQIRRAVVSVPSNIAEGEGRGSDAEFIRFLNIAHGSLREVETQLLIATRLGFSEGAIVNQILDRCGDVGRLVNGLIRSLRTADRRPPTAD